MKHLLGGLPDMLIFFMLYVFLAIGIYITVKVVTVFKDRKSPKGILLRLFTALVYNAINFYMVYDFMTVAPHISSGNGNPHIPYIFVSSLLFLSFCFVLSKKMFEILLNKNGSVIVLIVLTALLSGYLSIVFQLNFETSIKEQLNHPMSNWLNWWKDIHLNYLYFNFYTFLLGISISVFLAGIFVMFKRKSSFSHLKRRL